MRDSPCLRSGRAVIALSGLAAACTSNRPVEVTPEAVQLTQYLEAHPTADLQVTDSAGHRYWLHNPVVQNDSLIGASNRSEYADRKGVPLSEIRGLKRPEFNTAKTLAFAGGLVAAMATVAAVAIDGESEPIY